mgnify:CR=1 FL=1
MKAIRIGATGDPSVLQVMEVESPTIRNPDDVKVRLRAAGLNPIDTKIRRLGLLATGGYPAILGCDGAGEVIEVGSAVTRFSVGDSVWFCHGGLGDAQGNYAEFNVLNQCWLSLMPENLSFHEAAAVPLVLITAYEALFERSQLKSEGTILIHGGGGGVGHLAVQLAMQAGANVFSTASSQESQALLHALGCERLINYRNRDFVTQVLEWTQGVGVDSALDTVGGETFIRTISCMAHYGDLITLLDPGTVAFGEARLRNLRICFEQMLTPMLRNLKHARLRQVEILDWAKPKFESGELKIHLNAVFPFESIQQAHEKLERGSFAGKLVLDIS